MARRAAARGVTRRVNGAVSFTWTGSISRLLRLSCGSRSRRGISSRERQHRLAWVLARDQVRRYLRDVGPRPLHADVRGELARGAQVGETAQAGRRGVVAQLGEDVEPIELGAAGGEEGGGVQGDPGGGRG